MARKSDSLWGLMIERTEPYTTKARTKYVDFFDQQLEEAMAYLDGQKSVKSINAEEIIDWEQWIVLFEEFQQYLLTSIIQEYGPTILQALTISVTFDMDYLPTKEFIAEHSYKMAVNVNETTKNQIRGLFTESTNQGYSVAQIEKRIIEMFDGISKTRANMIARTEPIRAYNAGSDSAYRQSGVVQVVRWLTAADERKCIFCAEMHGKTRVIQNNYFNQGDRFSVLDANGKIQTLKLDYSEVRFPPLHTKCRCTEQPVIDL